MNKEAIEANAKLLAELAEPLKGAARVIETITWAIQRSLREEAGPTASPPATEPVMKEVDLDVQGQVSIDPETPLSSLLAPPTTPTFHVVPKCECAPVPPEMFWLPVELGDRSTLAVVCPKCGALWASVTTHAPAAAPDT